MPVSASFRTYVLEQLGRATPGIRARNMFGGVGIYAVETFFALIADDTLYFKVDDVTRPAYVAREMGPFRPFGEHGEVMQYYQLPEDIIEDVATLESWVADAIAVAQRAKRQPKRRGKR